MCKKELWNIGERKFHRKGITTQEQTILTIYGSNTFCQGCTKLQTQRFNLVKNINVAKNVWDGCVTTIGQIQGASREMKMKNTVCGFFAVKNERTSVGSINLIECSWIMGGTVKNNSAVKEQSRVNTQGHQFPLSLLDESRWNRADTCNIYPLIMLLIRNRWNCG